MITKYLSSETWGGWDANQYRNQGVWSCPSHQSVVGSYRATSMAGVGGFYYGYCMCTPYSYNNFIGGIGGDYKSHKVGKVPSEIGVWSESSMAGAGGSAYTAYLGLGHATVFINAWGNENCAIRVPFHGKFVNVSYADGSASARPQTEAFWSAGYPNYYYNKIWMGNYAEWL